MSEVSQEGEISKSEQKRRAKQALIAAKKAEKAEANPVQNNPSGSKKKEDEEELSPEMFNERRIQWVHSQTAAGTNPYPHKFNVTISLPEYIAKYKDAIEAGQHLNDVSVSVSGRVMLKRSAGSKLYFYTIQCDGVDVQIIADHETGSGYNFNEIMDTVKRGDIIGVEGHPGKSKKGELSVFAVGFQILTPCLRLLPDKFKGLTDPETRYRQRYLDLIMNRSTRDVFVARSNIVRYLRKYLDDQGFIEVETPMMNLIPGGATARPFKTYHNELDMTLFMRIAPELYLKQCVIGGMDRVYEVGRNFRNEGIDMTHNPEFTSCEFYMAYADYQDLMNMTEELLSGMVKSICGSYKIKFHKYGYDKEPLEIDFTPPFRRISMMDELEKKVGEKLPSPETYNTHEAHDFFLGLIKRKGVQCSPPVTTARMIDKLVSHFIEPDCVSPTFLMEQPVLMSPLAKPHRSRPGLTERFELFVAGMELCNAYTELNNPVLQKERFMEQVEAKNQGDDEAQELDEDFVTALEFGLPPTGGWGVGIDRLTMFLTDKITIKEVLLFPAMKPRDAPKDENEQL